MSSRPDWIDGRNHTVDDKRHKRTLYKHGSNRTGVELFANVAVVVAIFVLFTLATPFVV